MLAPPADARAARLEDLRVPRTKLPPSLVLGKELGRGANNRVYACTLDGAACVFRTPRRGSDTQQRDSATLECRHTLRAAELGVGPKVLSMWNARHAHDAWPSGLYMVAERYPNDLDDVLTKPKLREALVRHADAVGARIAECLATLAREHIFVFDLKPSNVVLDGLEAGAPRVRVIDYGSDFCEWACKSADAAPSPHVERVRRELVARNGGKAPADLDAHVAHLLFCTMCVMLASNTTHQLYSDRRELRIGADDRAAANPIAPVAARLLESMQGRDVALMRKVLRMDEVRGVLGHYHGRRRSGTRRTLAMARGSEPGGRVR